MSKIWLVKNSNSSVRDEGGREGSKKSHFSFMNTWPILFKEDEVIGRIVLQILILFAGISASLIGSTTTPEWSLGEPPFNGSSTSIGGTISGSLKKTFMFVITTSRILGPLVPRFTSCFREVSMLSNLSIPRSFRSPQIRMPALGKVLRRDWRVKVM